MMTQAGVERLWEICTSRACADCLVSEEPSP